MKREKELEAEHNEHGDIQRCLFCNVFTNVLVCGDFVQEECYRSSDRAAVVDSHADIIDIEGTEGSSFGLSTAYSRTLPTTAVQHAFPVHEVDAHTNMVVQQTSPAHEVACRESEINATGRCTSARRPDL